MALVSVLMDEFVDEVVNRGMAELSGSLALKCPYCNTDLSREEGGRIECPECGGTLKTSATKDKDPESDEAEKLAEAYGLVEGNEPAGALDMFGEVLDNEPVGLTKSAYSLYGYCLSKTGNFRRAKEVLEMAMRMEPGNHVNYIFLAIVLLEAEDCEEAKEVCYDGLVVDPDIAELHYLLGIALYALGKEEAAEMEVKIGLELKPREDFRNLRRVISGEHEPPDEYGGYTETDVGAEEISERSGIPQVSEEDDTAETPIKKERGPIQEERPPARKKVLRAKPSRKAPGGSAEGKRVGVPPPRIRMRRMEEGFTYLMHSSFLTDRGTAGQKEDVTGIRETDTGRDTGEGPGTDAYGDRVAEGKAGPGGNGEAGPDGNGETEVHGEEDTGAEVKMGADDIGGHEGVEWEDDGDLPGSAETGPEAKAIGPAGIKPVSGEEIETIGKLMGMPEEDMGGGTLGEAVEVVEPDEDEGTTETAQVEEEKTGGAAKGLQVAEIAKGVMKPVAGEEEEDEVEVEGTAVGEVGDEAEEERAMPVVESDKTEDTALSPSDEKGPDQEYLIPVDKGGKKAERAKAEEEVEEDTENNIYSYADEDVIE